MAGDAWLLEARGVGRRLNDTDWLLHDVTLTVAPGDRLALVGPSGGGKTLLLRSLALLDPLDAGGIYWTGETLRDDAIPDFRRQVIYLHQRPALFEGTVESNLRQPFLLRAHRARRFDRERVLGLVAGLGRDPSFLLKLQRDLSGGEAQIVALVRALQLDPAVLLLDEPTAALDRSTAQVLEQMVDRWWTEAPGGRAFVWVSHDPEQAYRVARRQVRMRAGRLQEG
jgi:putative ABC transport system ATP-binding protein